MKDEFDGAWFANKSDATHQRSLSPLASSSSMSHSDENIKVADENSPSFGWDQAQYDGIIANLGIQTRQEIQYVRLGQKGLTLELDGGKSFVEGLHQTWFWSEMDKGPCRLEFFNNKPYTACLKHERWFLKNCYYKHCSSPALFPDCIISGIWQSSCYQNNLSVAVFFPHDKSVNLFEVHKPESQWLKFMIPQPDIAVDCNECFRITAKFVDGLGMKFDRKRGVDDKIVAMDEADWKDMEKIYLKDKTVTVWWECEKDPFQLPHFATLKNGCKVRYCNVLKKQIGNRCLTLRAGQWFPCKTLIDGVGEERCLFLGAIIVMGSNPTKYEIRFYL